MSQQVDLNTQSAITAHQNRGRRMGYVIAFSGVDCSGKSTQICVLIDRLRHQNKQPTYIWLRVGYTSQFSALKNVLRWLLGERKLPQGQSQERDRYMSSGWKRRLWLHLAFADMAFETAIHIRILKLLGRQVVCDRYIEESEMDLVLNFGERTAQLPAWKFVKAIATKPDTHIFLDLPFGESLRRSVLKHEPFPDPEEKRLRRATLYEILKLKSTYHIIDARMTIGEIAAVIDSLITGKSDPVETGIEDLS